MSHHPSDNGRGKHALLAIPLALLGLVKVCDDAARVTVHSGGALTSLKLARSADDLLPVAARSADDVGSLAARHADDLLPVAAFQADEVGLASGSMDDLGEAALPQAFTTEFKPPGLDDVLVELAKKIAEEALVATAKDLESRKKEEPKASDLILLDAEKPE